VQDVYLAADPDAKAKAICSHLQEELSEKKNGAADLPRDVQRDHQEGGHQGVREPGQVDVNLVDAQQAPPRAGPLGGL